MRFFVYILLALGGFSSICIAETAVDEIRLEITNISIHGSLVVQMSNQSKSSIKIWKDSNSWGAARWRVLLNRDGKLETFFQNPNQLFTKNNPAFVELKPQTSISQALDINAGNWCGRGHCSTYTERGLGGKRLEFRPGDTVIVLYDVPLTTEATKMGVYHGVSATLAVVP